jgi:hypothetical protein
VIEKGVELRRVEVADGAAEKDEQRWQSVLDRGDALFVLTVKAMEG